jgi:hypothetical protein
VGVREVVVAVSEVAPTVVLVVVMVLVVVVVMHSAS